MNNRWVVLRFAVMFGIISSLWLTAAAQDSKAQAPKAGAQAAAPTETKTGYSGMYMFLKEGEFVQVTVEDKDHVTGFVSRYGDGQSDKGAFLDQFFKSGK